jgi:hypothetical protein
MKIHPEMREHMAEAMRDGLKWWKQTTPAQIKARVDRALTVQQKALHTVNDGKELHATILYRCDCLRHCVSHLPWCDGKSEIVFERKQKGIERDGRVWYGWSSIDPWGVP